jgi:hypothetical protein
MKTFTERRAWKKRGHSRHGDAVQASSQLRRQKPSLLTRPAWGLCIVYGVIALIFLCVCFVEAMK